VEETGVLGPVASHWQTLSHNNVYRILFPWAAFELTTFVVMGTDCIESCKSNYHTITTTAPVKLWINSGDLIWKKDWQIEVHSLLPLGYRWFVEKYAFRTRQICYWSGTPTYWSLHFLLSIFFLLFRAWQYIYSRDLKL